MVRLFYYCLFLPASLLSSLCTDKNIKFKFVCIGNSVELFQEIKSINFKTDIIIYKTFGDKAETIALRHMLNFSYEDTIIDKYEQKLSWENTTLLLHNFQKSDEATYVMMYNDSRKRLVVQFCALDAPTLRCNIDIQQKENFLIASLDNLEYCGTPSVSVRWMDHPHSSLGNTARLQLPTGIQSGTYIACIDGETLKCVTDVQNRNKCKSYTVTLTINNTSPIITELQNLTTINAVLVSLVLFGVIAILIKLFWKHFTMGQKLFARDQPRHRAVAGDVEEMDDLGREPFVHQPNIELQPT